MLFNSFSYVVFLPIIFALYWICVPGKRYIVLMLASFVFYAIWDVRFFGLFLQRFCYHLCVEKEFALQRTRGQKNMAVFRYNN